MVRSRRRLVGPLGLLGGLAIAFPLGVLAAVSFADVPPGHPFYYDIQEVANVGVTTGCGGGNYCPDELVTRGQMAAFLNRLGALGADKVPVVNATKLDGIDSTGFLKAGPITQQHFGPWTSNGNFTATIETYSDITAIDSAGAGTQAVQVPLVAPTSIGGVKYGLQEVQVCTVNYSSNVLITDSLVYEARVTGSATIINDGTDRNPVGTSSCYTISDPTPTIVQGNQMLLLSLSYSAAGRLGVATTTTTWVPTTAVLAAVKSKSNDTTSR